MHRSFATSFAISNYVSYGQIFQSKAIGEPPEFSIIQEVYGGNVRRTSPYECQEGQRPGWVLTISKYQEIIPLLKDAERYCLIKHNQARLVLNYLELDKQECLSFAIAVSMHNQDHTKAEIDINRMTDAYVAGLFAAEGGVQLRKPGYHMRLTISQKSSPKTLKALVAYFGFGFSWKKAYEVSCGRGVEFSRRILPHLRGQKLPQLQLALQSQLRRRQGGRNAKRIKEDTEYAKEAAKEIKRLKRL